MAAIPTAYAKGSNNGLRQSQIPVAAWGRRQPLGGHAAPSRTLALTLLSPDQDGADLQPGAVFRVFPRSPAVKLGNSRPLLPQEANQLDSTLWRTPNRPIMRCALVSVAVATRALVVAGSMARRGGRVKATFPRPGFRDEAAGATSGMGASMALAALRGLRYFSLFAAVL